MLQRGLQFSLALRPGELPPGSPNWEVLAGGWELVYDRAGDTQGGGRLESSSACVWEACQVGLWCKMKSAEVVWGASRAFSM